MVAFEFQRRSDHPSRDVATAASPHRQNVCGLRYIDECVRRDRDNGPHLDTRVSTREPVCHRAAVRRAFLGVVVHFQRTRRTSRAVHDITLLRWLYGSCRRTSPAATGGVVRDVHSQASTTTKGPLFGIPRNLSGSQRPALGGPEPRADRRADAAMG